jgi:hypothetical protein
VCPILPNMGTPASIIIGAVLIAAAMLVAMLVANHWQLQAVDASTALRLNCWTGDVEICFLDNKSVPESGSLAGAKLECRPQ